jgi:hypothetical protein
MPRNFIHDGFTGNKINEMCHRSVADAFRIMCKAGCSDEFIATVFQRAADIVKTDTDDIEFIAQLQKEDMK